MTRVSDLSGAELALWVARAIGPYSDGAEPRLGSLFGISTECWLRGNPFMPHDDWAHGGPLIEKHIVALEAYGTGDEKFFAVAERGGMVYGPTLLIAAMRALVASVYGEEVADV